jgi:AcrR family transcriptional regulator
MAVSRTPRGRWVEEGLRALGDGGLDAVRIEPLAQAIGVTKGGFYWHFADRGGCWTRCSTRGSGPTWRT